MVTWGMFHRFVVEFVARSAGAVPLGAASLNHEIFHHPVELAFGVEAFLG